MLQRKDREGRARDTSLKQQHLRRNLDKYHFDSKQFLSKRYEGSSLRLFSLMLQDRQATAKTNLLAEVRAHHGSAHAVLFADDCLLFLFQLAGEP